MILANTTFGCNVEVHDSSTVNNIELGDHVKVAKRCSIFGSAAHLLTIGAHSYIGPNTTIQGHAAPIAIGARVSIAQNVNIMSSSGPNASPLMQRYFPLLVEAVRIGNDSWIGANAVIMPGVILGEFCVVAANSFVSASFAPFSVIGGNPARLLRKLDINILKDHE